MTRLFRTTITVLLTLLCQQLTAATLQHVEERSVALQKLSALGVNTARVRLKVVEDAGELFVFEDDQNDKFVIVAHCKYREAIDDLVLAYSTESRFQGTESAWKKSLLDFYAAELRLLTVAHRRPRSHGGFRLETGRRSEVLPLITTRWGQAHPYNALCPKTSYSVSHKLTGCVATAMSQIMFFHHYPERGTGHLSVLVEGRPVDVDFSATVLQWDRMKAGYATYASSADEAAPVARLMYANALAVSSSFGDTGTSANNLNTRTALVNFWRYHPSCQLIKSDDQHRLNKVIIDNLQRGLPVIVSGGSHSYICDGFRDDYLHFNLGWGGAANGYYKVDVAKGKDAGQDHALIKEVLQNIRPDEQRQTAASRVVVVSQPGTLVGHLSPQELLSLRELTVSGPLDGRDIALLRRMAGATDGWHPETADLLPSPQPWSGCLQVLDLSQATLVSDDNHPYYRMRADGSAFKQQKKEYTFDRHMNAELFARFRRTSMSHGRGYRFAQKDSLFLIEFFTERKTLSPMMFFDCQNLREIRIPQTTRHIMGKAFAWCNSLVHLHLPASVVAIESGAFEDCYLLEDVEVERAPRETCHNLSPVKVAGRYGETKNGCHLGLFNDNSTLTCRGLLMNGRPLQSIPYQTVY